ncbi:cobaltochelatase subunit CobN [Polycladidibacter hongkongensis]|uniref:cobaltochelatase subunit CobN n=1 Tax=Polycladidibacter hongkongensis TaxID=1647556 RepID=UPI000833541A|nr:cobaltochelatase subunit CobN [Pseudovibrio hongkongensis]
MHILAGQTRRLDEGEEAVDLSQSPADVLFLSAADTELAGLDAAYAQLGAEAAGFSLRLASQLALSHPYSVDLYLEQTVAGSRLVVVRLLGGAEYWRYGVERLGAMAAAGDIQLVLLPGDDKWDDELARLSSVDDGAYRALWQYLVEGGPENFAGALRYAAYLAGCIKGEPAPARPLPKAGLYLRGQALPTLGDLKASWQEGRPVAALVFYRALYQSGALAPVDALVAELRAQGVNALPVFVASLKQAECAAVVREVFAQVPPDVVLNASAFALSKAGMKHEPTLLDAPGAPVLQVIFSSSSRQGWEESDQGLSSRDLAMHVVLPELDGRLLTRALSFKEEAPRSEATQFTPVDFVPVADRVAFVAELAARWARLRHQSVAERKSALVLANYPNKDGRMANGVGLDTPASCCELLGAMGVAGYDVSGAPAHSAQLMELLLQGPTNALAQRQGRQGGQVLPLAQYERCFAQLSQPVQAAVVARWGAPTDDPYLEGQGRAAGFRLALHRFGNTFVGVQPARGYNIDPKETYHDPDLVPPHNYFAWYFYLRFVAGVDVVVHLGKHGNLEWLPGKALALSQECFPEAVLGPLPNLYPFIVNDPGEGAQAKRRLGSVIVDHLTPPLTRAESYGAASELETLLDEYYLASGVDARRMKVLGQEILACATRHGLDKDIGLEAGMSEETQLARLDAHLCDLKELQIRDGLHVLGRSPEGEQRRDFLLALSRVPRGQSVCDQSLLRAFAEDLNLEGFDPLDCAFERPWDGPRPQILSQLSDAPWRHCGDTVERLELLGIALLDGAVRLPEGFTNSKAVLEDVLGRLGPDVDASGAQEIASCLAGLGGQFVAPGPSGAPSRGRPDVLPTGRNFYSVDVRAVPTQTAWQLGARSAEALALRHFQEEGEWPQGLVLSCWGTANMRTGGDDIAQAMALIGARPVWEVASGRVSGFEVMSLSELKRPRVDVTLRISGFFRDAFPQLITLFDKAVRAIAALDEPDSANPLMVRVREQAAQLEGAGLSRQEAQKRAAYRVYGSKPGAYGAGLQALIDEGIWQERSDFAEAFLAWGGYAYGLDAQGTELRDDFKQRLAHVDGVVHNQDNREHDLLDSDDYYQFEGGLAATVETLRGSAPQVYHNDHSRPERPVVRTLSEEIGRVVRGRAANPKWIAGVMRHGYKGAFEMAASLDYLFAFAATTQAVQGHHFDQLYGAYIEDEAVQEFLRQVNPAALMEMVLRFMEAQERGLWVSRRNSAYSDLQRLKAALAA